MSAPSDERLRTPRNAAYRRDVLWSAAFIHRISGVALAVFLPFHFLVLALALRGPIALDGFLAWTKQPLVKVAEAGLVFFLAVHLIGGLRVLMIEAHGWRPGQRVAALAGVAGAALIGAAFLIGA
jgi:fumarate reductase subunit D